jgi:hypothetical protein
VCPRAHEAAAAPVVHADAAPSPQKCRPPMFPLLLLHCSRKTPMFRLRRLAGARGLHWQAGVSTWVCVCVNKLLTTRFTAAGPGACLRKQGKSGPEPC